MKLKFLILALVASIVAGCNDDISSVGISIQPGDDTISVFTDTFRLEATTIQLDSVYARTTTAQLGELYDPLYGYLKSDFLCQFYCPDDFSFEYEPYEGVIDSVIFYIYYYSSDSQNGAWVGDSLAPMRAEVFKVTSPLQKNFYTNVDPEQYCDMQTSLGSQSYTAYNSIISDSLREEDTYYPHIRIKFPTELGQEFYEASVEHPEYFEDQESFNEYCPGVYVTTTFGSGNILSVSSSVMSIYYNYVTTGSEGQDSLVLAAESFSSTQEVIQLSRFKNTDMEALLEPNDEFAYIKSPAGICVRLKIPTAEISALMGDRIINDFPIELRAMPQEDWQYALEPADYLLILPEDSVKNFFEEDQINDDVTSYLSEEYDESTRTYEFSNLANILKNQIDNAPDEDLYVLALPVERDYTTSTYYYYSYESTTSITNYMAPSGVRIRINDNFMNVGITSCKYAR